MPGDVLWTVSDVDRNLHLSAGHATASTTNDQRPTGESNSTRREMDRQAFAESIQHYPAKGSHSKGVIVDEVHKLAYCYITKNACTKFKLLFHTLATNGTRFDVALSDQALRLGSSSIHETMLSFTGEKGFLADTLIKNASSDWSTFLVVRDPAERLLSGFKNKCLGPKWCEGSALNKTAFAVFAERVIDKVQNGRVINDHFLPQHQQCGLDVLYPKYVDDVVVYNKETVAADTIRFLEKHHLEAFNEGYGEFGNETLFETQTGHTTRGKGDDCSFYQQYYDKELYQKVRGAFSRDYDLFGLDEPEWTKCLQ